MVIAMTLVALLIIDPSAAAARVLIVTLGGLFALWSGAAVVAGRRNRRDPHRRACLRGANFTLARSRGQARAAALDAILSLPDTVIVPEDSNAERLRARTPEGLRSHGEELSIELASSDPANTTLRIESWSSWPTTVFDWGVNRRNVKRIVAALLSAAE